MRRWLKIIIKIIIIAALAFFLLYEFSGLYENWLWYKDLGYNQLFWIPLISKFAFWAVNGTILFAFIAGSLLSIRHAIINFMNERLRKRLRLVQGFDESVLGLSRKRVTRWLVLISALISYTVSFVSGYSGWLQILTFLNPTSFNMTDPVFNKDLAFYIFQLPLFQTIFQAFFAPLTLLVLFTVIFYAITGVLHFHSWKLWRKEAIVAGDDTRRHLAVLIGTLFLFRTFGYIIERYQLLYSQHGHMVGAGYTDLYVTLPILTILVVLSGLSLIFALAAFSVKDIRLVSLPFTGTILFALLFYGLFPSLVQMAVVDPNELNKEAPYIQQEIRFTDYGYGLDKIKEENYPGNTTLTAAELQSEQRTLDNIRLNDTAALLDTYNQKQGFRLYYKFNGIDVDRYVINGEYRMVMLSPRELSIQDLEAKAKTFVNLKLKYTHGYGVVASFANALTADGLPQLAIKDVPELTSFSELESVEPRIYYGEDTNDWAVADTDLKEFDYPQGNDNAENSYKGQTGITLTSLNKFMISLHQMTGQLYLTKEINSGSKILLWRNIKDRVEKLVPFLNYDEDPYLVIDNGRLKWIIDAYTTSNALPYSSSYPNENLNYIRNSVKVVVDAYNGTVDFYIVDKLDPVLKTYEKIFPGVFKGIDQMPASLQSHLRYPETLFTLQSNILKNFHSNNPAVFYNKEDAWDIAKASSDSKADGKAQYMEPYYTIMQLPGSNTPEFVLMVPFTPVSSAANTRNNLVAWLAARMDGNHYGELVLYRMPKDLEIDGPVQIESRIDQDPEISKQLALWDEGGSSVIRGNLLILPIKGTFLYVEPIYLQSNKSGSIPEMKQVILAYHDKLVMADNLSAALEEVFGSGVPKLSSLGTEAGSSEQNIGAGNNNPDQAEIDSILEQIEQLKTTLDRLENQLKELAPQ